MIPLASFKGICRADHLPFLHIYKLGKILCFGHICEPRDFDIMERISHPSTFLGEKLNKQQESFVYQRKLHTQGYAEIHH